MSTYDKLTGRLPPQSILQQRYLIVSLAGRGGMSAVYRGVDTKQGNRNVAIKEMSQGHLTEAEREEAIGRFRQEYQFLSKLQHPNLPLIYDTFNEGDRFYFVMDFIEGETLEDKLKKVRRGRFSTQQVFDIGIALCDVLGYLHAQRPPIVFRDVKPANIMLTKSGRIYLIDFGIARHYTPDKTRDTAPLGSLGYAAPEQYGKAQTTAQTDIYGLGATLQTLLTGKEPLETLAGRASRVRPIPEKLQALLTSMLEQDASKRPQSMNEVKQSLQWLKEHSTEQRVKRTLAFTWNFLAHSGLEALLLMGLLLFIYLIFLFTGFFNTPLWIPCLLLMLSTVVCRSAYYLRQEVEEAASRLNAKEVLGAVLKRLEGSILYALIPAILFFYLYINYNIQRPEDLSIGDALFLGGGVLASIIYGLSFFKREISWLLHFVPSWRRARKHQQVPPLQQHMHKHR